MSPFYRLGEHRIEIFQVGFFKIRLDSGYGRVGNLLDLIVREIGGLTEFGADLVRDAATQDRLHGLAVVSTAQITSGGDEGESEKDNNCRLCEPSVFAFHGTTFLLKIYGDM